ncbi:MAG: hypothetical protein IJE10_07205 [Clostridia bacterium]|nr:hypothetical protein [Clostridia bacterium]
MKKIILGLTLLVLIFSCTTVFAAEKVLAPIVGLSGSGITEGFDAKEFDGLKFETRDLGSTFPSFGFITEGSVIESVDVSKLGVKAYKIPSEPNKDNGMRISSDGTATKRAYIDIWNVPLENIRGAENYRIEYNIYVSLPENSQNGDVISDISFYAVDVPSATKNVGIIGFARNGKVYQTSDVSKNKYAEIKDAEGKTVTYENNAWQHVVIDMNAKTGKYTFYLNGKQILKDKSPASTVEFNAESGAYRIRLSFNPVAEDSESYIIYDDILFAYEAESEEAPAFMGFSDGFKENSDFYSGIKGILFSGISSPDEIKMQSDGKEVKTKASLSKDIATLSLSESIAPDRLYSITFGRFSGNVIMKDSVEVKLFAHKTRIDKATLQNGGIDAEIVCGTDTEAVLTAMVYYKDGSFSMCASEPATLKAGETKALRAEIENSDSIESIKVTLVESIKNPKPLCAAVTVK